LQFYTPNIKTIIDKTLQIFSKFKQIFANIIKMLNFTKSKSNMKIGNKLRVKRDNKKLSQQEIADYLHISQRTYSNFESDKSEPSLTQLSKLAEVLEFNLLDMLQEQGLVFNQSYNEFKDNSQCIIIMKQKNLLHN